MGVITVTKREQVNWGNLPVVVASSSHIANGDTWRTGLAVVNHLFHQTTAPPIVLMTWTTTGGVVTFTVINGPCLGCELMAIGGTA